MVGDGFAVRSPMSPAPLPRVIVSPLPVGAHSVTGAVAKGDHIVVAIVVGHTVVGAVAEGGCPVGAYRVMSPLPRSPCAVAEVIVSWLSCFPLAVTVSPAPLPRVIVS